MAPPLAPSNLVATAISASRIDLAWDDNSSDETKFELERSLDGTTGWVEIAEPAANAESYIDSGLPDNAQRFYRIRAVNGDGNSAYTSVANATTLLATRAPLTPRLYLHNPAVVLAARVNLASATYPLDEFPVDGVTSGAVADVKAGMTVIVGSAAGLDDYGRQRARLDGSGSTLFVGRSSYGNRDGELMVEDNAFVTVLNDRRVWAKIPYIASDGTIYKDSDLVVGTNTTTPPPVSNCGPGFAATIDADTGTMVAIFNGESSFATADGATITGYLWDIEDGSFLTGSAATDDVITASFPAGFRYVSLTVTDSNAKTHTAYCPVYARDPDNDTSFDEFSIESHRITVQGQTMSVKILADAPRLTYPDGTLALIWQNEPVGLGDRYHMLMIGWLDTEPAQMNAGRTGLLRDTTLNIVDVAGRLDQLPGFPQTVANDTIRDTGELPDITWSYMTTPNLDKYLHYLLHWHSTALELADFIWSGTGDEFEFVELGSEGQSLWSQVDQRARAFLPDFALTCERAGRILIVPDPMLRDAADRTATVMEAIDESEWSDIRYTSQRHPRVHWLRSSAIVAGTSDPIGTVFSIAPGHAPGQGVGELTQGEQLAASQTALNAATGHRYARANAPTGLLSITLVQNDNGAESVPPWREIEPAYMQWVTLTVSSQTAARRGLTFTTARGLVKEMNIRYTQSRTGLLRTIELLWERETVGVPGATVTKLTIPVVGDDTPPAPPAFVPPLPGDPLYYYSDPHATILWDGAHVFRTWDIQEASPTWELVDTGISGNIYDGQYVFVDADTVGMWLMTSTAIWFCADIMATTPAWDDVLPIATVQAAEATPAVGTSIFKTMFNYASELGYLCVATGPNAGASSNENYAHAYFWHTHDYGANWTTVDMTNHLRDFGGGVFIHGYMHAGLYAMNIYRSDPGTIWCIRGSVNIGGDIQVRVFYSTDLGHTWSMGATPVGNGGNVNTGATSLLNPFPEIGGRSYAVTGLVTPATSTLQVSTDAWATKSNITAPTGYSGISPLWRVNKRTFDDFHAVGWWLHTAENQYHLLETEDGGNNWTLLHDSGLSEIAIPNTPTGNQTAARHNTPNGWPPDIDQWCLIRANGTLGDPVVQLTLNNFFSLLDKEGNLAAIIPGGWTDGPADGFFLPRVGVNA